MTTIMDQTGIDHRTTTAGIGVLLEVLNDALGACAEKDLELLHAETAAGRALISLSALARGAASALGTPPGVLLTDGPGVVVVRDLVAATRLLGRAASDATAGTEVNQLVATAKGLHAGFLDAVTTAG